MYIQIAQTKTVTALTITKSLCTKYSLGIDHITLGGTMFCRSKNFVSRKQNAAFCLHEKS